MFWIFALITGIWALARISTHEYGQVAALLAATLIFGLLSWKLDE